MPLDITKLENNRRLTPKLVSGNDNVTCRVQSIVKTLLELQYEEIEKISSFSFINQPISCYLEKCNIEIPLIINKKKHNGSFVDIVKNLTDKGRGLVFCIGDSGCGKSTLLAKTLLDIQGDQKILPIYVNLNNASIISCNKKDILRFVFLHFKIKVDNVLLQELIKSYKFVFLFDGLDEKSSKLKIVDIEKAIELRTDDTFVISSRIYLYNKLTVKNIDYIVEFCSISADLGVKFLSKFFLDNSTIMQQINNLSSIIFNSQSEIFSNILMLALLAMHLKESTDYIKLYDKRRGTVMDSIIMAQISREIRKNNYNISIDTACKIIEDAAIYTYERHQKGQSYVYSLLLKKVIKDNIQINSDCIEKIINIYISKLGNTIIYKFIHSQFYDFFVAKSFYNSVKFGKNISRYLNYTFSIEINSFLSDLMRDGEPYNIYKKLEKRCKSFLNNYSPNKYSKLFLLLMHMQRTGEYKFLYQFASSLLDSNNKYDSDVEALLLHSKIIGGLDENAEELYYLKLINDRDFRMKHVGAPLIYYNEEMKFKLPYADDGTCKYRTVFYAYSRHFMKSDIIKHYYIVRRHNIFTIRCLIEQRKLVPKIIYKFYNSINNSIEEDHSIFGKKVKDEYERLIQTLNKYPQTENDF